MGLFDGKLNIKKFLIHFVTTFTIILGVTAIVTYLWNLGFHGAAAIDWETSFRLAIILGIALPVHWVITSKQKVESS